MDFSSAPNMKYAILREFIYIYNLRLSQNKLNSALINILFL